MQSPLLNVMTAAVIKAGKGLMRDFGEVDHLHISRKSASNFVTKSDIRTEKLLQKELSIARPAFGFLMEEGGEVKGKDPSHRWIIDPLDGTSNFIHAIPYFCISLGLERIFPNGESEIIAGVIFDPSHNELFTAEKGKGAQVNNRKLAVSTRENFEETMLVAGSPREANNLCGKAAKTGAIVRYFGASALDLAYLAAGRIDACWYNSIQPWDIAAGMLMVQEAGGVFTKLDGTPANIYSPAIIASNRVLYNDVQKLVV
ncbi:MAG: inositol monophosphatase family protein [Rickettsiales bacterium]|jgi:myo-inositol-1(or 4)-monophosphatase